MLRITIEIENPRTRSRRMIASGMIGNQARAELSDYIVVLNEAFGRFKEQQAGAVMQYPRFGASVWDLVARALVATLYGSEILPERPATVSSRVPVRKTPDGLTYVRLTDIPEPARAAFEYNLDSNASACPVIEGEPREIAYSWDLTSFLSGSR